MINNPGEQFHIFACPKPFIKPSDITNQTNAILSWLRIFPSSQITLVGKDAGVKETADKFKLNWCDVAVNDKGTPYVESIYSNVESIVNQRYLCYINSDIVLFDDFRKILNPKIVGSSLVVGSRWDTDVNYDLKDELSTNPIKLQSELLANAVEHPNTGIDYFLYDRNYRPKISQDFLLGRSSYDHHIIFSWNKKRLKTISASNIVRPIHMNHHYNHIDNYSPKLDISPEIMQNRALAKFKVHDLEDCTYFIDSNLRIKRSINKRIKRKFKRVFSYIQIVKYKVTR
jgi:hypothetical protein